MDPLKYSIWLLPSSSEQDQFSQLIQSLAGKYDAPPFDPHCTLFSPVHDIESAKTIIDQLNFKPFEAKLNGLSHSDYIWKTIFFELESNPHLLLLNYLIDQAMVDSYSFEPHVSLIYKEMTKREREAVIHSLTSIRKINFDRIAIINTSVQVSEWSSVFEKQL